jgi:phosphorylcholine metabolism protein LicD
MIDINRKFGKELSTDVLHVFDDIMQEMKIPYYLDGGTLLGAYRDKDFCEDDHDDIDLTTFIEYENLIEKLTERSYSAGFTTYHTWKRKFYKDTFDKITSSQVSFKKHGIKIDLMFKIKQNNKLWWTVFKGNEVVYKAIPEDLIIENNKLGFINFKERVFNAPINTPEYLKYRYGDFNVKVHRSKYSCYTSDKAITTYEKI